VTAVLRFDNVTRVYRSGDDSVRALDAVSFEVRTGEMLAVMGPSGSGKSTLLAIAGGLDTADTGTVEVEGTALRGLGPTALACLRRDRIGYVFQDFNLIGDLTAAENVALPRELAGVGARSARRAAISALEEVGVAALGRRFPEQLSGGQRQRVAIARALIGERRLILADEPTGALDSLTSEVVLEALRSRADAGAAVVLVTHEPRYAGWADRTMFLRDGRIVDATTPRERPEQILETR